jgi:DNA-binding NarL/FixJ family response regulator
MIPPSSTEPDFITQMDMEKIIYIVGPLKLQNSLMVSCLEHGTGIRCEAVEDASYLPRSENEKEGKKRLVLLDCVGSDPKSSLSTLEQNGSRHLDEDLLGLFNLAHGSAMEEESLPRGVRGFFYQGDSIDQFMKGIETMFNGELWLSRKIMTHYILNNHRQSPPTNEDELQLLTAREKSILTLIAEGASNDMISDRLCISLHTVKTHLYNIFKKIHVSNRLQAALWVTKNL